MYQTSVTEYIRRSTVGPIYIYIHARITGRRSQAGRTENFAVRGQVTKHVPRVNRFSNISRRSFRVYMPSPGLSGDNSFIRFRRPRTVCAVDSTWPNTLLPSRVVVRRATGIERCFAYAPYPKRCFNDSRADSAG